MAGGGVLHGVKVGILRAVAGCCLRVVLDWIGDVHQMLIGVQTRRGVGLRMATLRLL